MNIHEAKILIKLQDKGYTNFPKIMEHGVSEGKPYILMQKLGTTLQDVDQEMMIVDSERKVSLESIC